MSADVLNSRQVNGGPAFEDREPIHGLRDHSAA
jgi:hypothetical protein